MTNSIIGLILVTFATAIYLIYLSVKKLNIISKKLPPLENFLPFPRMQVRIGALIFGIFCWSSLFVYLLSGDSWLTFRAKSVTEIVTPGGDKVPSLVSKSASKAALKKIREPDDLTNILALDRDRPAYAAPTRENGFWRLDAIAGAVSEETGQSIHVEVNRNLVPAFSLREVISSDAQTLWSGWFAKQINESGEAAKLEVTLWCGFDVSSGTAERFCFLSLPVPLFLRLYIRDANSLYKDGVTLSAPIIFLHLNADGARIVGSELTQHKFKKPKNKELIASPEDLGLSFSVQNVTGEMPWQKLTTDTLTLGLDLLDKTRLKSHRLLWSEREIHGKDRWIFAGKGTPGFAPQFREIGTPKLFDLAHDFLVRGSPRRVSKSIRDWVVSHLSARAILAVKSEHHPACGHIARTHESLIKGIVPRVGVIQSTRGKNHQIVLVDRHQCPTEILPLLFINTWTKF